MPRSTAAIAGAGTAVLLAAVVTVAVRGADDPQEAPAIEVQAGAGADGTATREATASPTPARPTTDAPTIRTASEPATSPEDGATEAATDVATGNSTDTPGVITQAHPVDELPETGGGALTVLGAALVVGAGATARRHRGG